MAVRVHLILVLTLSLLQARVSATILPHRVSASRLPHRVLLNERLDGCPCVVQWGGLVRNPSVLQVEVTPIGGLPQSRASPLPIPKGKVSQKGYCEVTHVEGKGDYQFVVYGGYDVDKEDLRVSHIQRNPCVPTSIIDNGEYECDDDCDSDCVSPLAKPKMSPVLSTKQKAIITDEKLASYNVYIRHKQNKSLECTGSLIAPRWVLTAGHCDLSDNLYEVIIGRYKNEDGGTVDGQRISVKNFTVHEDYKVTVPRAENVRDGVAFVKDFRAYALAHAVFVNDIQVVALAHAVDHADEHILHVNTDCRRPTACRSARMSVYGLSCMMETPNTLASSHHVLRSATVRILDNTRCAERLDELALNCGADDLGESPHICTTHGACGSATCKGDSGGPLVVEDGRDGKNVQIGITSYRFGKCGVRKHPDIYTRVSAYAEWIHNKTFGQAHMDPLFIDRHTDDCPEKVRGPRLPCTLVREYDGDDDNHGYGIPTEHT